jgi:hypothetical protein
LYTCLLGAAPSKVSSSGRARSLASEESGRSWIPHTSGWLRPPRRSRNLTDRSASAQVRLSSAPVRQMPRGQRPTTIVVATIAAPRPRAFPLRRSGHTYQRYVPGVSCPVFFPASRVRTRMRVARVLAVKTTTSPRRNSTSYATARGAGAHANMRVAGRVATVVLDCVATEFVGATGAAPVGAGVACGTTCHTAAPAATTRSAPKIAIATRRPCRARSGRIVAGGSTDTPTVAAGTEKGLRPA